MGLEAIELMMEVEDHFGISIRDNEVERVRTVGDLVALIQSRIASAHLASCPTLAAFLELRSGVREIASQDTLRIRTGTRVVDILTRLERRRLWRHLRHVLGATSLGLRRPPVLRNGLACIAIMTIVFACVAAVTIDLAILPLTLAFALFVTAILYLVTLPFCTFPPDSLATFGAISQRIAAASVATKQLHLTSVNAILDELRPIFVETLGVNGSDVVPAARFIEDLGMG